MEVFEITALATGVSKAGVNYLQPVDSWQNIYNGFIYRQVLQSRQGFKIFATDRVADGTRIMGIFEHILPDNSTELLVCSKQFLYRYNEGTDAWIQVPMAGGAPPGGFNITSNNEYVSGTTYPFSDGSQRFVFTGKGMAQIYQYDGTSVTRFNLVGDNPDYQAPAAGALTNAWYVIWFGERLNFFNPRIAALPNPQMVLYSGIRDSSGNGDKFNVPGSGSLSADTSEYINGASILGNFIVANFSRSNWVLEKTRDAFNPYFWRKVPSVLGTDAGFSFVSWNDETRSMGKTGIISTDGRASLRVDNKIPDFTEDNVDSDEFDMTYGGFDRFNGQFLFAYYSGENDATITQDKVLVNNYEENTWAIYDARFSVFGQTDKGKNLVWDDIYEVNNPSWARMDETEEIWNKIGIQATTQKTLAGDNDGFVYEINQDYDDYFVGITGITQAASAVVSTNNQAFKVGDRVTISNVNGMTQINNFDPENPNATFLPYTVTAASLNSVTITANTLEYAPYIDGGTISKIISFSAETIPFNPYRSLGRKVYVSHIEFLIDTNNGNLKVDIYQDNEESPFKSGAIAQPIGIQKASEWVTIIVNNEANFITFVLTQESPAVQAVVTSLRIHCSPGGLTSG